MQITQKSIQQQIETFITEALRDKGLQVPELRDNTELLGGELGIDSLDLAAIVIRLSEWVGRDPFESGFIEFRTIGELAGLYSKPASQPDISMTHG